MMKRLPLLLLILLTCCSIVLISAEHPKESTVEIQKFRNNSIKAESSKHPRRLIEFDVDNVEKATQKHKVFPARIIFERKIGKQLIHIAPEHKTDSFIFAYNNALIQTVHKAFDEHRPLRLSPDIIWLAICQGTSIHINENFNQFEKQLFKANKPETIEIRNDSLEHGAEHWSNLISRISSATQEYTKDDYYTFFNPQFSTTTPVHQTSYEITMLHAYKKAFKYIGDTGCGIPSISLSGTKKDWQEIYNRLQQLDDFGLTYWREELEPIISEFINTYDGKVNKAFWQDIYKNITQYNLLYSSGWIIKLFPYIVADEWTKQFHSETGMRRVNQVFKKNEFIQGDRYLLSTLSNSDFPNGILEIDLIWNNYLRNFKKELSVHAGFFAIKQHEDLTLEPVISWAIQEKNAPTAEHSLNGSYINDQLLHSIAWIPTVFDKCDQKAIFQPQRNKSSSDGVNALKKKLLTIVANRRIDDTLEFVVLSNGHISDVTFSGNRKVFEDLKSELMKTSGQWSPALQKLSSMELRLSLSPEEKDLMVKVNSKVRIILNTKE